MARKRLMVLKRGASLTAVALLASAMVGTLAPASGAVSNSKGLTIKLTDAPRTLIKFKDNRGNTHEINRSNIRNVVVTLGWSVSVNPEIRAGLGEAACGDDPVNERVYLYAGGSGNGAIEAQAAFDAQKADGNWERVTVPLSSGNQPVKAEPYSLDLDICQSAPEAPETNGLP